MVSKARLDLPEPESPVMTIRLSRGRSTSTPFRLCSRAPRTEMWVRLMGGVCSRFVLDTQGGESRPETWGVRGRTARPRSEEHTSELQSLMRISYAVFCLKKKKKKIKNKNNDTTNSIIIKYQ